MKRNIEINEFDLYIEKLLNEELQLMFHNIVTMGRLLGYRISCKENNDHISLELYKNSNKGFTIKILHKEFTLTGASVFIFENCEIIFCSVNWPGDMKRFEDKIKEVLRLL